MNNAELIEALRHCANDLPCETESYRCKYADIWECNVQLRVDAADALEAAEKKIEQLEKQVEALKEESEAYKFGYLDGKTESDRQIEELQTALTDCRLRKAEAQLPKEAHWVAVDNGHGVCSNCNRQDSIDNMATHCRYCGARMKGERDGKQ